MPNPWIPPSAIRDPIHAPLKLTDRSSTIRDPIQCPPKLLGIP